MRSVKISCTTESWIVSVSGYVLYIRSVFSSDKTVYCYGSLVYVTRDTRALISQRYISISIDLSSIDSLPLSSRLPESYYNMKEQLFQ